MILRQRYYDGYGNELRIDEVESGMLNIAINRTQMKVPVMKLFEMLKDGTPPTTGKHVKKDA